MFNINTKHSEARDYQKIIESKLLILSQCKSYHIIQLNLQDAPLLLKTIQ